VGAEGEDDPTPVVRDRSPVVWEDRPFSPANEPPGRVEHLVATRPFLAHLLSGALIFGFWLLPPHQDRPWWSLAGTAAMWLVLWPSLHAWRWRASGPRRREYDRRVRVSEGGAATLDG